MHKAIPGVNAHGDTLAVLGDPTAEDRLVLQRAGADDGAGNAGGKNGLNGFIGTQTAADLYAQPALADDTRDEVGVGGLPGEGAVQVHHVQVLGAGLLEGTRLGHGVIVVDGALVGAALAQAHALATHQIDRGQDNHYSTPLLEGTPASRGSGSTAMRKAWARPLKTAS